MILITTVITDVSATRKWRFGNLMIAQKRTPISAPQHDRCISSGRISNAIYVNLKVLQLILSYQLQAQLVETGSLINIFAVCHGGVFQLHGISYKHSWLRLAR